MTDRAASHKIIPCILGIAHIEPLPLPKNFDTEVSHFHVCAHPPPFPGGKQPQCRSTLLFMAADCRSYPSATQGLADMHVCTHQKTHVCMSIVYMQFIYHLPSSSPVSKHTDWKLAQGPSQPS